jgi:hypothetical protein
VLLAVVIGLLVVVSLVAFVVPLRVAMRSEDEKDAGARPSRPASDGTTFVGLDHLALGVELQFDRQRWFVVGVQRATPADGPGWTAWHLDDRGQGGLMLTGGREDEVVMAVRAERPETLDPEAATLRWRNHDWTRTASTTVPVRVEGERRAKRLGGGDLGPVSPADVERSVYARDTMPTRRLILERSVGDDAWNAWIGTAVPGRLVDVWPPAPGRASDPEPAAPTAGRASDPEPTAPAVPGPPAPGRATDPEATGPAGS